MSTNYFFKSVKVTNYRGLNKLNIDSLRRVNIIGGLNGSGKSTLLDALFLVLDRRNPMGLMRPFAARGLQLPYPNGLDYVFGRLGMDVAAEVATVTAQGDVKVSLSRGKAVGPVSVSSTNVTQGASQGAPTSVDPDLMGIHIRTTLNGQEDEASCTFQNGPDTIAFNNYKTGSAKLNPGSYISALTRVSPLEDAQRYSALVKERRTSEVVAALQFVDANLQSFQLLQEGNQPVLYAETKDGSMMHSSLLGGGIQNVLSIVLLMATTRNGVILFDEVDAAIHYSKLKMFWQTIARIAEQQNCQVFAVTHSKECIAYALRGLTEAGRLADLQYVRLEKNNGDTDCVTYSGEELASAFAANWEVR